MDVCEEVVRVHQDYIQGGANILWVKKNHDSRGERLQIATYNVRTLLKDEHGQVLEEVLKETTWNGSQ